MTTFQRLLRRCLPLATLALLMPTLLSAQEPAVKSAPRRLVVSTAVPQARQEVMAGLKEVRNGSPVRGNPHFRRALELDPGSGFIRAVYAFNTTTLVPEERSRELDRAVVDAARAPTPERLTAVALRDWNRGDRATAMALFGTLRTLVPDEPYFTALYVMPHWDQPEMVVDILREFQERNPDVECAYNSRAYALAYAGRPAEAIPFEQKYLELMPDHPNAHASYGDMLQWTGKLDEAQQEYRRALELDPSFTAASLGLAQVAQARHDYRTAHQIVDAALVHATTPLERHDLLNALAFMAVFAGDDKTMLAALPRAIAEADSVGADGASWSHAFLATFQAALGNAPAAREQLPSITAMPAPLTATAGLIVSALTGSPADLRKGVEAVERAQPTDPGRISLARVIEASSKGDVGAARTALAGVKGPDNAVVGQAFLLRAARHAKDAATAREAQAEIAKYTQTDWFGALAHMMARAK